MKKQTLTKIISGLIVFVFVVSMFQFALPIQAATESSMSSLYSNPNNGDNTYKFKIKDVVNSKLLTNIVGCTGVVNKVATWMARFISSPLKMKQMATDAADKAVAQVKQACAMGKKGVEIGAGLIYGINDGVTPVETSFEKWCATNVEAKNDKQIQIALDQQQADAEVNLKTQCFDGIAITLAKNQLTAMTRSAMNWVNSGYGGNPFFVQNMQNLTRNIEKNVLETGTDILLDKALGGKNKNPYAQNFLESTANVQSLRSSSTKFLGGLTSDLSNFISDPNSYFDENAMTEAERTQQALHRAQVANDAFARDFSVGGWNGWLALTQKPQNNPLGFNMIASQYLADVQSQEISAKKDELAQNNGFLSQKECSEYMSEKSIRADLVIYNTTLPEGTDKEIYEDYLKQTYPNGIPCLKWKTTTPGSIIKDKVTGYLGSPERQLELAKTINDSLNALFSVLIDKLAGGGLSSLSDSANNSSNWIDTMNSNYTSPDGNTTYDNNGAYDGFNLTRDLGNNYIYTDPTDLGTWNASTNEAINKKYIETPSTVGTVVNGVKTIKLYPETPPENYQPDPVNPDTEDLKQVFPVNAFYTVKTAGNTKLMVEGYNGWAVGDRAFWDGSKWQNWKTDVSKNGVLVKTNPIKKRGVIQIQQDYIVAAKEILKVLPSIMPKLGELDYCLPGPNPSYKTNSTDAQSAYQDWIGSMYVGPMDINRDEWRIDQPKPKPGEPAPSGQQPPSQTYDNLANIFTDNPNTWDAILLSPPMSLLDGFYKNWTRDNDEGTIVGKWLHALGFNDKLGEVGQCVAGVKTNIFGDEAKDNTSVPGNCQNYHWHKVGSSLNIKDQTDVDNRKVLMNSTLDYVNNHLFQDFYNVFDEMMNELYFKNMTSKYKDTETSISQPGTENPAYVPMAAAGLDLTKNIVYYNDDIAKATKDYTDAITQAKINIAKLEPIRNEVSEIIKAAQDRRDNNLLEQINKVSKGAPLTIAQYKTTYASCLNEENISFYDPEQITANTESGNCDDGIDNDLNGLVDCKDSACSTDSACNVNGSFIPNSNIIDQINKNQFY